MLKVFKPEISALKHLFSVTFEGDSGDDITVEAFEEIEGEVSEYDSYISASVGDDDSERMASEMNTVMAIACVIILAVLLISSHTYMEIPVLILTFGTAAILNKGTNFIFGTISFVSNSIAVVLQLALAIDYAIILCHRYTEERETNEAREAVITALCKAIPEISGSCLTTLSGLMAMGFMQFRIGFDMSIVLIKAIIISILTVFTLMPGLLMSFSGLIDKTHHKNFIPSIDRWSNGVIKTRHITSCIFVVLIVICFFLSNNCPYAYSDTELETIKKSDTQIARKMINETFSRENVLAVVVPSGDYAKEQALKAELEKYPEVESVTGLASVEAMDGYEIGDELSPREFSELTDMDIEIVRLLYSAYAANSENYGRIVGGIDNYKVPLLDMFDFVFDMLDDGYVTLDEDIENTRLGKVADCHNYGEVCADRNTGGIIGAMAIEYAKDPEDEIEKPNTLNFTYRTKAIVQLCINDGEIVGKKDCTGGIVGLSEIGTVYECQNYADIESTDGKYAGGIVGKSEASIRKSYAKSKVAGERYVGGIAGKAGTITASYAIANVSGDENIGAICGAVENNDELYRNYYVDSGLGAVDGISYSGKAEPIEFDELKNINGIPKRFISFTVTFVADDKIVETQDVRYGDDTARIKYPEIPSKKGHFGNWQEIEVDAITEDIEVLCEYQPYITVLASAEKNESGKLALALAEGEFTDKAELHAYDSSKPALVKADGAVKVYEISLSNTDVKDDESVTIRVLNENKDKVTAWRLNNGNWEKVKVSSNGKYVILHGEGTKNTI